MSMAVSAHERNKIQARLKDYFALKFKQGLHQKLSLRNISPMNSQKKEKSVIEKSVGDLGTSNSAALERLKQKLEVKTLSNYQRVLDDIRR
jgi:hypothetical protein